MSRLESPAGMPVATTCPYCGVGCGVLAARDGDGVSVRGDPQHPANYGRLCVKGAALGETVGLEGRLLRPMLRRGRDSGAATDSWRATDWSQALDTVAQRFASVIREHGPDAVAFYVSGQLLTEDYYVANKLMKGYIGTANIDTNSRLCMSSAVAGHKRAFGEDVVPVGYDDLEQADLIVLAGSNTAWCHPVIFQRIVAAKQKRPALQIVVIDPRRTATCEQADLHLPIRSGSDVWLFNGLLAWLHDHGIVAADFVAARTHGADDAVTAAIRSTGSLAHVARQCGLPEELLRRFYALFARTERVVTAFSMGVNQSSAGTDKVNSIINCHLLSGRIGRPGMGPFSLTGQPNAMGGREVGGLSNQLAAHLDLEQPAHRALVQRFWNSPRIAAKPGYKAVDLFDALLDGRVKAVWIMATNPVVSLPAADRVKAALSRCEFVVVSEIMRDTDTAHHADVLLPATGWGERDGTVTNSERRISRQRPFLAAPGEARHDWWIVSQVAQRLGYAEAFGYRSAHEIFVEHARLTAFGNAAEATRDSASGADDGVPSAPRLLNLAGLCALSQSEYDTLPPLRWPILTSPFSDEDTQAQLDPAPPAEAGVADCAYRALSPDSRRLRLVPLLPRAPVNGADDEHPLILNTGRVRDHWHTMSRTGKSPKLATHVAEPYVEIHPQDALLNGVQDGRLARVATQWGACVVRVRVSAELPRRQLFVPIHWNGRTASDARVGALVNPVVDPLSGEPEFKHTPARIEPFFVDWYGFLLVHHDAAAAQRDSDRGARTAPADGSPAPGVDTGVLHAGTSVHRAAASIDVATDHAGTQRTALTSRLANAASPLLQARLSTPPIAWWTRIQGAQFTRYELAGRGRPSDWSAWARALLGADEEADWIELSDASEGLFRAALIEDDRIAACLFASPRPDDLPARNWLSLLFAQPQLDEGDRHALLAGQAASAAPDAGPTVCSCFGVGRNPIVQAIREQGCRSPEALGARLRCGTNCGSCIPELRVLIATSAADGAT
jgi:assimilatory nitrate reductase catalytic subunit